MLLHAYATALLMKKRLPVYVRGSSNLGVLWHLFL